MHVLRFILHNTLGEAVSALLRHSNHTKERATRIDARYRLERPQTHARLLYVIPFHDWVLSDNV